MTPKLTLYSRKDCCLCAEMKAVVDEVAAGIAVAVDEIDIDQSAELREKFSDEIPILDIDGRKAFKYRVTKKELERCLRRKSRIGHFSWFKKRP